MKKIVSLMLVLIMLSSSIALSSCDINMIGNSEQSSTQKEEEFYYLVDETKDLLDIVADDIYSYWYDCIYKDKYRDDINYAILCAQVDNEENINTIEENTTKIKDLYKEIKNGKLGSEAKAVMQAYNDYYTLVIEVSGSFNTYSANKETCKKELASALDDFSFELD